MSLPLVVRPLSRALPAADVVAVFTDGTSFPLPPALTREVRAHLARAAFKAEPNATHAVPLPGRPPRTLLVIGKVKAPTIDVFRRGVASAVQRAKAEGLRTVAVIAPENLESRGALGRAFAEGALLANYRFTAYRAAEAARERRLRLRAVILLVPPAAVREVSAGVRLGILEGEGTMLARDLVNEPSSRLKPASLVEKARGIARQSKGAITVTVWNRAACEKRGMGAFLAVAQGSAAEPYFIHLVCRPRGKRQRAAGSGQLPRVVLVGKGITFDSGGLSLKPAEGMETMKIDMAGAAAVLGAFSALPRLQLPVEVHGMIAACENMPSGTAVKPGDIVRTVSGKTIEVLNTDAEGRLTLADVFGEAVKLKPDAIVDLATLTGACVVSLGEEVAGLFSNSDPLADAVLTAAEAAGEPVWRLPLVRDYRSQLKSEVADIKNIVGKRWGGAITAALFLQEFVGNTPWVHLDIAGPSYAEKQTNPVNPVGGTGFGVRTLLHYLESVERTA